MTDDELLELARKAPGFTFEDVARWRELTSGSAIIAMIERYRSEVERLKHERDEAREDTARVRRLAAEDSTAEQQKRVAAESALAAAQRRVGEARDCLDLAECQCPDYTPFGPECGVCKARAALAGKEES